MPELDIYLSWKDIRELVDHVLLEGVVLIPDLRYETEQHTLVRDIEAFDQVRRKTSLFFILRDTYFLSPLEIEKITKRGKTLFYKIAQRSGGPTIDLLLSGEFREAGKTWIRPGFIGYHPTFWNTTTHQNEKPPDSLVASYKSLVKQIKKGARRIKPGVRVYWVGRHAQELVRQGAKLVGFEKQKIEL